MKDIWIPVSAAVAQQRNVESIANNIANANTPGYKKDQLSFREYLTVLDKGYNDIDIPNKEFAPEDFYHSYGAEHAKVKVDGSYTIHEQGQLTPTGNPLDFGLRGQGMFEVLTPFGVRFTRAGSFNISPEGHMITNQGYYVLDAKEAANPKDRLITVTNPNIVVNLQGEVSDKGTIIGKVAVKNFKDVHALRKEGSTLFSNPDVNNITNDPKQKTSVYQGFIEQSNVNVVSEMNNLIQANRKFESIQKVIKTYDDIAGRSINELSKF